MSASASEYTGTTCSGRELLDVVGEGYHRRMGPRRDLLSHPPPPDARLVSRRFPHSLPSPVSIPGSSPQAGKHPWGPQESDAFPDYPPPSRQKPSAGSRPLPPLRSPALDDGLLEVFCLGSVLHMAGVVAKAGRATRLAQVCEAALELRHDDEGAAEEEWASRAPPSSSSLSPLSASPVAPSRRRGGSGRAAEHVAMQLDGEPWAQPLPGQGEPPLWVRVRAAGQASVLKSAA